MFRVSGQIALRGLSVVRSLDHQEADRDPDTIYSMRSIFPGLTLPLHVSLDKAGLVCVIMCPAPTSAQSLLPSRLAVAIRYLAPPFLFPHPGGWCLLLLQIPYLEVEVIPYS